MIHTDSSRHLCRMFGREYTDKMLTIAKVLEREIAELTAEAEAEFRKFGKPGYSAEKINKAEEDIKRKKEEMENITNASFDISLGAI